MLKNVEIWHICTITYTECFTLHNIYVVNSIYILYILLLIQMDEGV
jgi:hypothetical protein